MKNLLFILILIAASAIVACSQTVEEVYAELNTRASRLPTLAKRIRRLARFSRPVSLYPSLTRLTSSDDGLTARDRDRRVRLEREV